ncbi:MAG: acyl carrier protein [Chloroflexi bacterium]|nr:acyl carrier protein [Chloroflexota bacterium]MBU1746548.1 acyl carrier protein [Chloroflexota bacterium]
MASSVYTRVKQLVVDSGVDESEITPDAALIDDLNLDPIDLGDLILAVEEEFEIEIPNADARLLFTVRALVDYVEDQL